MSVCLVRVEGPDTDGPTHNRGLSDLGTQVTLPVVLGRGSLLKCGDKRVSRRHAYLDWEDKGVLLTAVHQNPTYVVVGKGELQEVMEGSSVLLSHGDRFGLLKDAFWYMVNFPNTLITEEKNPVPSSDRGEEEEKRKEEEKKKEEERRKEEENEKRKQEEEERKEEDEKENNNKTTKGELIESRKLVVGDGEAVNGDAVQESVTTSSTSTIRRPDTTDGGTLASREGESKALKPEHRPQRQEGTEGAAGGTETHNSSSPSPTPSTAKPCTAPSPKESVIAVTGRERSLPQWLQNTSSGTPAATPPAQATPRGRRGRSKPPAASPRTLANPTTPAPLQSDEDLFTLNTTSKRQRRGSPQKPRNTTTKTTKSPQKRQKQTASPAKGRGNVHHQMSDDSDGDDAAVTTTTTTISTTTTTTTTSTASPSSHHSSPQTPARRIPPVADQMSDSEGEAEQQGEGGSANPPAAASPAPGPASAPTTPARAPPRPSCQFGAKCYRKNLLHRQSEAHPGDPDYRTPGNGDSDGDGDGGDGDRPECEYGVDCYRKNPQHRRDFKHTRFPQPQRRAKRKARQQKARQGAGGGDGSEEDDYDFDDPFLNDGSSDDYAPTDDDSDSAMEPSQEGTEEEDTKRMLKEAKKFVRKRK